MKAWVYKAVGGTKIKIFAEEMKKFDGNREYICIGTTDLPVEPVKKEVVKEVNVVFSSFGGLQLDDHIPKEAYDIKVTYKVKE